MMTLIFGALVLGLLLVAFIATAVAVLQPDYRAVAAVIAVFGFGFAIAIVGFVLLLIQRMG